MAGLTGSAERRKARGCEARIVPTKNEGAVQKQVMQVLGHAIYDVIVVAAGLRPAAHGEDVQNENQCPAPARAPNPERD